jgi:hypothetical protein
MRLPIEIDDLKEAFTKNPSEHQCIYYLDTITGKIILQTGDCDPMDIDGNFLYLDGYPIEEFPSKYRFLRLPSNKRCYDYDDMQLFITTIQSGWLRNKLEITIDSYKAFQRFQDILQQETENYQWSDFTIKQLEKRVLQWLESQEMEIKVRS